MTNRLRLLSATLLVALLLPQARAWSQSSLPDKGGKGATATELAKSTRSWDGQPLPAYPPGQPEVTILRISIPPGTRLADHKHPVINAGVLLSGELVVSTPDGQTLHLKAGDPIIELVNTLHHGYNPGDTPAEIIVFYAGSQGTPITTVGH